MVNGDIFGIRLWDKGLPYSTIRFPERLEVLEMGLSLERQKEELLSVRPQNFRYLIFKSPYL